MIVVPCLIAWVTWWRQLFGALQSRTPMRSNDNKEGSLIFFWSTIWSHLAPRIIWAHNRSSKKRLGKTSFYHWWCAAASSSPSLWIPWKVSWVIYKILLGVSTSRNKEGNYLVHSQVMSPPRCWGMNSTVKSLDFPKKPTCGQLDGWSTHVLSKDSQFDNGVLG